MLLLEHLKKVVGIQGKALDWFTSYLKYSSVSAKIAHFTNSSAIAPSRLHLGPYIILTAYATIMVCF